MSNDSCILTTKDFMILEEMRGENRGHEDPLTPILRRKLESARVVFLDDVPENVATLNSRVTFSVDGREPETRVISLHHMPAPIGMLLPITTPRGLALLGLAEGQAFTRAIQEGVEERIVLEEVRYQPEAAHREKMAGATGPLRLSPSPG